MIVENKPSEYYCRLQNKIEMIKLIRKATHAGLVECKYAFEFIYNNEYIPEDMSFEYFMGVYNLMVRLSVALLNKQVSIVDMKLIVSRELTLNDVANL
jgi:hypothetical protein